VPIVLVSNDVNASDRKDITGVQHHYPNGYRNLIQAGQLFVYYRGIRRAGNRRGEAEYFGQGVIGAIRRDPAIPEGTPKKNWAWYCAIEEYVPFLKPVPAKVGGEFFERIKPNMWRNVVRELPLDIFKRIVAAAGMAPPTDNAPSVSLALPALELVEVDEVSTNLMTPSPHRTISLDAGNAGPPGSPRGHARRSRNAKLIADRAEQICLRHIGEDLPGVSYLRHVAPESKGWDIEYVDATGTLNFVEVKGASEAAFPSFELTRKEFSAARQHGPRYWVYLVAGCLDQRPRLQRIQNPALLLDRNLLRAEPSVWEIWLHSPIS